MRPGRPTLATMVRSFLPVMLGALANAALAAAASAPGSTAAQGRGAIAAACERATQETLRDSRGPSAVASFAAAPALQPGAADAAELVLRGSGQVRTPAGARPFSYSCTYDTVAGAVAGVVLRDAGVPAQTPAARSVEPDLSHLSPLACESAAAGALKRRWPHVSTISFNAGMRQVSQDRQDTASLRGQGTALPSPRDPSTHFSYDCAVDTRNGRVTGIAIGD